MSSVQISITATEEQQEILISELSDLGAEGFEQTKDGLIAYFNELNFKSYEINELLKEYSFQTQTLEDQNWNAVWESNFSPVIVNDFCAIRAEFHEPIKGVQYEIIITPKMSFGTGHHATTYMMIEQMSRINFKDKTVFDFGTGTGILSILAEKLGAAVIKAIDVDDWSIINAQENMERNDCNKIQIERTSNLPQQRFDVVLANINKNVILQYLPYLKDILLEGSLILFSGLLIGDEQEIVKACYQQKISLLKKQTRENWISLLCVKEM
jgi:ribosomal protein L11 methyltransferase